MQTSQNSLTLYRKKKHVDPSKDKQKIMDLKSDCALFSWLYIASQTRECDIQEFFKHGNQKYPPSLSSSGKLRQGNKSDLVRCLEAKNNSAVANTSSVEVTIMDGAALVHLIKIGESKNFRRICKGHVHPTCIFWTVKNPMRGSRLECIPKVQSETFNEGKQRDRNTQASV